MLSISLSWKTAVATVATLATVGAGAVVARAATTEDDFGQQVRQEVVTCKASAARTDTHGIGDCVSAWVTAHHPSDEASPEPSESPSPEASETPKPEPSETPEVEPSETPRAEPSESPENDEKDDARDPVRVQPTVRAIRPVSSDQEQGGRD